jgi:drug/metabolite transporter (DMT)-like permease
MTSVVALRRYRGEITHGRNRAATITFDRLRHPQHAYPLRTVEPTRMQPNPVIPAQAGQARSAQNGRRSASKGRAQRVIHLDLQAEYAAPPVPILGLTYSAWLRTRTKPAMSPSRLALLTALALVAFAGNSLLCRAALAHGAIDAGGFTLVRLVSGAVVLWGLVRWRNAGNASRGSWRSALALAAYAAAFSFAYLQLTAATGALLLFGAVQATMSAHGLWTGERLRALQGAGLLLACAGLVGLLLPGLSAPPLTGALLMLAAGIAWGVYSLRGRGAGDPLQVTAGNFLRAVPFAALLALLLFAHIEATPAGIAYAIASGALASGVGYAIWYTALPHLRATSAATAQLAVPIIAALGGVLLLGEAVTMRLVVASVAIPGGIALMVCNAAPRRAL